ncbi:MAG: NYN domain-containing protein [Gemmatimonadaceae bacterium]
MARTYIYVDGFNLYYGALRKTAHRWLNLEQLCRLMLPTNDVQRINYYTAKIGARIGDPGQPIRQQIYFRALATLPSVRVHLGHYLSHAVWMPLENPPTGASRFARVIKTEEKGSDVNLATHLVSDAYEDAFDVAVLIPTSIPPPP